MPLINEERVEELIYQGIDEFTEAERERRRFFGSLIGLAGLSLLVSEVMNPAKVAVPVSVIFVTAAAMMVLGVQRLLSLRQSDDQPVRDHGSVGNIVWISTVIVFVCLLISDLQIGFEHHLPVQSIVGLAILVLGSLYKILMEIRVAENRVRDSLLARFYPHEPRYQVTRKVTYAMDNENPIVEPKRFRTPGIIGKAIQLFREPEPELPPN